jgi:CO/xanthine dehydrogenase FAD-binding subunit
MPILTCEIFRVIIFPIPYRIVLLRTSMPPAPAGGLTTILRGSVKVHEIDYIAVKSVPEAVSLLSQAGDQARILSGGTDLLVQMREGRRKEKIILDIKPIPEVNELTYHPVEGLCLGAAVPCLRIIQAEQIASAYPGLMDAVRLIGGTQIQGRASVGGNLCNASPAADTIPALIVHKATCLVAGPSGQHAVPVEAFCTGPGQSVLGPGEFLVQLHIPPPEPGFGASYLRFIPRNEMDIAVAGAGASVLLDANRTTILSARVALGAVAPTPLFVVEAGEYLAGRGVAPKAIDEAARLAQAAARPINDMRGTVAQRRHLSAVLTRRALERAITRAGGNLVR